MSLEIPDITLEEFRLFSTEELSDFIELCGPYATVSESVTASDLNGATLLHLNEEDLKELLPKKIGDRAVLRSLMNHFKRMATRRIETSSAEAVPSLRGNEGLTDNESNTACTDAPISSNTAGCTETNRTRSSTASAAGSCSKTCGEWTNKITIPAKFSPKVMAFLEGNDPILSRGIRVEIVSALFHKSV